MAITTLAGAKTGAMPPNQFGKTWSGIEAAGVWTSMLYESGINPPSGAAAPSPGIAGAALTSYAGQISYTNPASGNSYLYRVDHCGVPGAGAVMVLDRLWHNSGITVTTTTAQTVNSVAFPARDRNGSTNGDCVLVAIEVSTATTNAGAVTNTTMSYTNEAGTAGRTATMASFPATATRGTFMPFQLVSGDMGVRSIQSVTLGTSYGGGTIHLVAYRVIGLFPIVGYNVKGAADAVSCGFVRCFDNTVPFLVVMPASPNPITLHGRISWTHG